jgi:hypothetical protein
VGAKEVESSDLGTKVLVLVVVLDELVNCELSQAIDNDHERNQSEQVRHLMMMYENWED